MVLPNGSIAVMIHTDDNNGWSGETIAVAPTWQGPYTVTVGNEAVNNEPLKQEDPFMFVPTHNHHPQKKNRARTNALRPIQAGGPTRGGTTTRWCTLCSTRRVWDPAGSGRAATWRAWTAQSGRPFTARTTPPWSPLTGRQPCLGGGSAPS